MAVDLAMLLIYRDRRINGLEVRPISTLKCQSDLVSGSEATGSFIQPHLHYNHFTLWYYDHLVPGEIYVFDTFTPNTSRPQFPDKILDCAIQRVSHRPLKIIRVITELQTGEYTCGFHCIALALELVAHPKAPFVTPSFKESSMSEHLVDCFQKLQIKRFPRLFKDVPVYMKLFNGFKTGHWSDITTTDRQMPIVTIE